VKEKVEYWIDAKKLREERGWLQGETSDRLGVSRSYLSAIENGRRNVSMNMMEAMRRVFGVKYEEFQKVIYSSGARRRVEAED
jgi:transcriptional regulator with XRE-family HTH domain